MTSTWESLLYCSRLTLTQISQIAGFYHSSRCLLFYRFSSCLPFQSNNIFLLSSQFFLSSQTNVAAVVWNLENCWVRRSKFLARVPRHKACFGRCVICQNVWRCMVFINDAVISVRKNYRFSAKHILKMIYYNNISNFRRHY